MCNRIQGLGAGRYPQQVGSELGFYLAPGWNRSCILPCMGTGELTHTEPCCWALRTAKAGILGSSKPQLLPNSSDSPHVSCSTLSM